MYRNNTPIINSAMDTTTPNDAPINGAEQAAANINKQRPAIIQMVVKSIEQNIEAYTPIYELCNNKMTWSDTDMHKFCDDVNKLPRGTNSQLSDVQLGIQFEAGVYMLSSSDGINHLYKRGLSTKNFCAIYLHPAVQGAWDLCCKSREQFSTTISPSTISVLLGLPDSCRDFIKVPSNLPRSFGELYERICQFLSCITISRQGKPSQIARPTYDNARQFMVSCPFTHQCKYNVRQRPHAHQHTYNNFYFLL